MEETGTVTKLDGDNAEVTITPGNACKKCPAQGFCRPSGNVRVINVQNQEGLMIGDKVTIQVEIRHSLLAIFAFFGLPVLFSLIGILFGQQYNEISSLIAGTGGFIVGLVIAKVINDAASRTRAILPRIVMINRPGDDETQS